MSIGELIPTLVSLASGVLIGIIGYFLKRTISLVDKCETDLKCLETSSASKEALEYTKRELKERLDKQQADIEGIKADYITKEDFFREQAKMDRKLDRILDILMERKGV